MAIEVRIPTILRQYTEGQKAVEGSGDTLADLLADLESRHTGIQARIIPSGSLASKAAFIRACISSSIFFCMGATSGRPMKARASSGVMSISILTFITAPYLEGGPAHA